VDAFADNSMGACWDFGHGNQMYADQRRALRQIGSRLKATHLNDNMRNCDSHTLPFLYGNTDWETLLPTLTEIGYCGDLALEVKFHRTLPRELQAEYHKLAFEFGSYCVHLAEGKE
jgi:sugar phosphate isomerase/epimerase